MKNCYKSFQESITNHVLKTTLETFSERLSAVSENEHIRRGLLIGSEIRRICQQVLFEEGLTYIWLVPIETSIYEYSENDFTAFNPYNGKTYALVQSPQIQKETAAVTIGSNFRIIDCYRGEKTDFSHSNIFQQLDIELAEKNESEIRRIAGKLVNACLKEISNVSLELTDTYSYTDLVHYYGTDSPNLCIGLQIEEDSGIYSLRVKSSTRADVKAALSAFPELTLVGDKVVFPRKTDLSFVREVRKALAQPLLQKIENTELYGYWVVDMPYAKMNNGTVEPVHHVMTLPKVSHQQSSFSFESLSDEELCSLECNSFDLIICGKAGAIEVLGGDERIHEFDMQFSALKRLNYDIQRYAFLLEALHFNDEHQRVSLGGFAVGIDRLAQFISGTADMKFVQLFPTNLPEGNLLHAIAIEDFSDKSE